MEKISKENYEKVLLITDTINNDNNLLSKLNGISCEIDKEYFEKGLERIENVTNQQKLF